MERTSNTTAEELTSRRAILAAVLGAAAATAAAAVLPAEHASAANGDPLILGQANTANDATDLDGQLVVHSSAGSNEDPSDVAVQGTSLYGTGVLGHTSAEWGATSAGVRGVADDPRGVGIAAVGDISGYGLTVRGKVGLQSRSGRVYVAAGRSYVDVDLRFKGSLPGLPLCFAILNSYRPGVFVTSVRADIPSGGMLRIYLNGAVTSRTAVAWFVLN